MSAATKDTTKLRETLHALLDAMQRSVDVVEAKEEDPGCRAMWDQLTTIEDHLYDTISPPAKRKLEEEETNARVRKAVRERGLDELLENMDSRIGRMANMIALGAPGAIQRGNVRLVVMTLLAFCDRVPIDAFDDEDERDPRVGAVLRALRSERRP